MPKTTIQMKLEKAAKSSGADRYAGAHEGETVTFYVPQSIARAAGATPVPSVTIVIETT